MIYIANIAKFVAAFVGLLVMPINHSWLAIAAADTACIAGGLIFQSFRRHDKKWSEAPMAALGPAIAITGNGLRANSATPAPFDAIRWAQRNPWLTEGQADDRIPMNGSVTGSRGTPSEQRAFARRSHQVMFKKWSQARHD